MSAGIASIALFAPVVASNAIFSVRRASRGVESIAENPVYGIMNMDIAAAQVTKGVKAVDSIASSVNAKDTIIPPKGAKEAIQESSKAVAKEASGIGKFAKGAGKVIKFTADHINPIICVTGGIKVLTADDKADELARESTSLACMFAAEAGTKRLIGMPYTQKINGKDVAQTREALYRKNPFLAKQVDAMKQYCSTKKALKYAPSGIKGGLFVLGSIFGYEFGNFLAKSVLGERKKAS